MSLSINPCDLLSFNAFLFIDAFLLAVDYNNLKKKKKKLRNTKLFREACHNYTFESKNNIY
jgi:hypothetical protein